MKVKTSSFEEIHRSFGGPYHPRFMKLIFSPQILLNKSVNAYYTVFTGPNANLLA